MPIGRLTQFNDANRLTVRDSARPESRMGNASVEKALVRSENGRVDEMVSRIAHCQYRVLTRLDVGGTLLLVGSFGFELKATSTIHEASRFLIGEEDLSDSVPRG